MDFLDPKKQHRQAILLLVGYVLVGVALLLASSILFYIATKGIGVDKKGQVVQNGLLFVASTPAGANIQLTNSDIKAQTNARLSLVSGTYGITLTRSDYRPWKQTFTLEGASVLRVDYPFLFPTTLKTTSQHDYAAAPGVATQSPDRRWLLVQQPGSDTAFDVYDLKNPKQAATVFTLPASVITAGASQSYTLVDWSNDNQHVVLKHSYGNGKWEFILLDRTAADKSVNLTSTFNTAATDVSLINKKFDQYYLYTSSTQSLQTASLSSPTPTTVLDHVLNYKSYGTNIVLYASSQSTLPGKVSINLLQDGKTYPLRTVTAGTTYLLDLTQYSGAFYVVAGASSESKIYIYKNPVSQLNRSKVLVPIYILKTPNPTKLSFSPTTRFIMDENGSEFSVFDAEHEEGYSYDTKLPLDAPQPYASWMDGSRLQYISGGKLVVFDFDHTNQQTLVSAAAAYLPFYTPDYKTVEVLAANASNNQQISLTTTSLRTPADQ